MVQSAAFGSERINDGVLFSDYAHSRGDTAPRDFDYRHYFEQLLNVCDEDITAIALRFFPKNDLELRRTIKQIIQSAVTSPWSHCTRLSNGANIHESLYHICQSFQINFETDELLEVIQLLNFHLSVLFSHDNSLLSEESVLELCELRQTLTTMPASPVVAGHHLTTQLSAMLLKDPILGCAILEDFASLTETCAVLKDSAFLRQMCQLFEKAVQIAADDLPYIDTLAPHAQRERIVTVLYLLSKLHVFTSIVPLSVNATCELVDSLVGASNTVRPFSTLVKDCKLQFALLCGDLAQNMASPNELCELLSKALLSKAWAAFDNSSNASYSKVLRLFSGLLENVSEEEKLFWLFLASFTEKKTYIELFINCCQECLDLSNFDLLKALLEMKPFSHNKIVWFLMLTPRCRSLSQTLKLKLLCFPLEQSSQLNLNPLPSNNTYTKLKRLLIFLRKVEVLQQRKDNFDEMSQEKLEMQLEKCLQTSLLLQTDLALIEHFLEIGDLGLDIVIDLIIELASVSYQPSGGKSVRFKIPAGASSSDTEPLTDTHILAQIFSHYAYCALRNMTDAVYGCSVYLSGMFKDENKNSIIRKLETEDEWGEVFLLNFSGELVMKYHMSCTALLDYGRTYCRLIYPLGLRLEVIENAFSLLFITYDHVHERIQAVAEEDEGEVDSDDEKRAASPKHGIGSKGGSSLASSSVFTQSTFPINTEQTRPRPQQQQIVGCLANEFLFRDMLYSLNECTKELVNDMQQLENDGVSFRLTSGHLISLKSADDVRLSDHINRESFHLPGFKDRLYRIQRAISEALWRMSIISGVAPAYGSLELRLSRHEYFKREFKLALAIEWERQRHLSSASAKGSAKRSVNDSSVKGTPATVGRTISEDYHIMRNSFVEKLASTDYMMALCWSANRRDLERCNQILGSYPDKFDASSYFRAEIKFQHGLGSFIAEVLLAGVVGKRLVLAVPFESSSKLQRPSLNRSTGGSLPSTPTASTASSGDGRMSALNQLVATSLTQFEIKEKLHKLFDSDDFGQYVIFFRGNLADCHSRCPFVREALLDDVFSSESIASVTAVDLAFCFSPNLETAAALLSNLPTNGLGAFQQLLGTYHKHLTSPGDCNISDVIANSLKWFTSSKLIQPDWTPSGVLVSPLFNVSPDLVARTRSGIMSLSRLISMTSDSLDSADHDKAEAMLTQLVTLLSAEWVETARRTIFLQSTSRKKLSKPVRCCYLSSFWNRLKDMYRSLGELGLQNQQHHELKGPLDLLAFSPESIFSQIIFSMTTPTFPSTPGFSIEEIARRLSVDLLHTIASSSCAQFPSEAHEMSIGLVEELFFLAMSEWLDSSDIQDPGNENPIVEKLRPMFMAYFQKQNEAPASGISARLWMGWSSADDPLLQVRPPAHRLNYQTAKLVYDSNDRLFVLVSFLSDFAHLLSSDANEDKSQPEITAVKAKLRSLKALITENFRPLLTYMSLVTIPLVSTLNPSFPSYLDSILLLPSTTKAILLISDLSSWFTSTILRTLMKQPDESSGINSLSLFDILPDPVSSLPSVVQYRDMVVVYAVECFFTSSSQIASCDLDLSRVVQLIARISDPCLRIEVMRKHCFQFTLSGFDYLVLTCPLPKIPDRPESIDEAVPTSVTPESVTLLKDDTSAAEEFATWSAKELVEWLHDCQRRVDLWMRLSGLMRLDPTTTTVSHIHSLITNQSDYVADTLISAGDFSTGLQLLNICGSNAFPVALATRLMAAYLTSHIDDAVNLPEQQIRVVQQLDNLAMSDPESSRQLVVSFLNNLVQSSASASCIAVLPSRVSALLDFCKTPKIRELLKEDSKLVDHLDQMVTISKLLPDDLKEPCGPLIHKPLYLVETLVMNVKVELAISVAIAMLKSPLATQELEISIQNIVAVYAFKALELPTVIASSETASTVLAPVGMSSSSGTPVRRIHSVAPTSSSVASGSSPHTPQSMTRPFLMPVEAPEPKRWMHDANTETCTACHRVRFTMFVRRHHCRRCGRIVCGDCSRQRATVRGEADARVCDDCYTQMLVIGEYSASSSNTPSNSGPAAPRRESKYVAITAIGGGVFQWQLSTEDEAANSTLRQQFCYESAPNLALCLSVLSLCQNPTKTAQLMLQIVSYLSKYLKPTREIDAALVLSIMKQLLMRAKIKFAEHSSDISAVSGLATMCDSYSKAIDFLDSLLQDNCQPIPTVSELIGRESSQRILSQLLSAERYAAAVRLASLMRPDLAGNAWLRWGLALVRVGCFESARQKFVKCLPKMKSTERRSVRPISKQLQEIVAALEGVAKRHPNIVAALVSEDRDGSSSMTIRDLLVEPQQLAGKGALMTDPLPKQIFDEAVFYLTTYGNDGAVISFFQRHGYWPQAARFIIEADCQPEVFVTCLLLPAAAAGRLLNLEDQMLVCDPTLVRWEKYISASYQNLTKSNSYNLLHRLYVFSKDYIRAAYVCLRHFFPRAAKTWLDLSQNVDYLHQARGHLEAYIDRSSSHWGKVEPPTPKRPTWEDSPPIRQFLPQPEVQRLSNAISLQFEVLEVMKARSRSNPSASFASTNGKGMVRTLFTDMDSDKMIVVKELLTSASLVDSFALARRIVIDFRLDPRVTYGNLGHELARNGCFDRLRQLLICLRDHLNAGQGETNELVDDIICAAVRGIHDRPEFAREQDALIAMLSDDDAKIEACLLCGKLRSAYLIAIHGNRERDVRRISDAASRLNQPLVKQICDQWLDQFNKEKTFPKH